jgi:hypothetical protein
VSSEYRVSSTSWHSADVSDVQLSEGKDNEGTLTRRVLRPTIVDNPKNKSACVRACLMHQRRHSKTEPWHDVDSFNLAELKKGQEVRLQLHSGETLRLFENLQRLYQVGAKGIPPGLKVYEVVDKSEGVVVRGKAREVIKHLVEQNRDDLWQALDQLQPNLTEALALSKLHQLRKTAIDTFKKQLESGLWDESGWQRFFENNTWIFGYGLAYQFLGLVDAQPHYGGTRVNGRGGQRGDMLMATEADVRFTVLVDIKRPDTPLLSSKLYRNKTYKLSTELVGGVCQLQSNCLTWESEGARQDENRERLASEGVITCQPRGILVIGHTSELKGDLNKQRTFELFRRGLSNPEILTYDELFARASYITKHETRPSGGKRQVPTDAVGDIPW